MTDNYLNKEVNRMGKVYRKRLSELCRLLLDVWSVYWALWNKTQIGWLNYKEFHLIFIE